MEIVTFKIVGISPLLQNNPKCIDTSSGLKSKSKIPPEEQAEIRVYRNPAGEIVMPTTAFRSSLFRACTGRKLGKFAAKSLVAAAVFPVEAQTIILNSDTGKPAKKYAIHEAFVNVNNCAVMRYRPMIEKWATLLALEVDTDMLPNPNVLFELMNIAGRVAGVGSWRPANLGTYGRFRAETI